MSAKQSGRRCDWREVLEASRDLDEWQKRGFGYFRGWFESWGLRGHRPAEIDVARHFWKEVVMSKAREPWQLEQWAESMRWPGFALLFGGK